MVPAMLEIGHTLIEALDLYEVHQQFMEKIEVRNSKNSTLGIDDEVFKTFNIILFVVKDCQNFIFNSKN